MKVKKFLEDYSNNSSVDVDEVASAASEVTDAPEVAQAGQEFLSASRALEEKLTEIGFRWG